MVKIGLCEAPQTFSCSNTDRWRIDTIRESNNKVKDLTDLVTIFVGGTGGIGNCGVPRRAQVELTPPRGASTAKELFLRATRPRAYIVGRSEDRGTRLINELKELQPAGKAYFIQKDVSTVKATDELCAELREVRSGNRRTGPLYLIR